MNHHETIEMLQGLKLGGQTLLRVLPQAEEMVLGCTTTRGEMTIAYNTSRFGNEANGHLRIVTLRQVTPTSPWTLESNVTLPMTRPITSRTGNGCDGLPVVRNLRTLPDFTDTTVTAPSTIKKVS